MKCGELVANMTTDETREWKYRYDERLGILCGANKPTAEQIRMAREEADRAIEELRKHGKENQ